MTAKETLHHLNERNYAAARQLRLQRAEETAVERKRSNDEDEAFDAEVCSKRARVDSPDEAAGFTSCTPSGVFGVHLIE